MLRFNNIGFIILATVLAAASLSAGNASFDVFYTQGSFFATGAVGRVHAQYDFATNSFVLSGNTTLYSGGPTFGAAGLTVDPNTGNLLIAGGGTGTGAGSVYQMSQTGSPGTPFAVNPDTTVQNTFPRSYGLTLVPANGGKSGFPANYLVSTEKDYGYGRISILPLTPVLGPGIGYPVTGDDVFITSIAFAADGTAYYGSGTEESNAGNFGLIIFTGTQFVTSRLFGQPVGQEVRGGIIFAGTHGLSFDPYTGHIFTAGGTTVGQYDPQANAFHTLAISSALNGYEFAAPFNDGQGHVLLAACCGLPGDDQNGAGSVVLVDYSSAPGHLIDAASSVQYQHAFLATNLGAAIVSAGPPSPPSQPVITQQPQATSAIAGEAASFQVVATGSGETYQWQSKPLGAAAFSSISGATGSVLTIPAVALTDGGTQFNCVVTNGQGSTPSAAATLTVLPASTKFITSVQPGTIRNNFSGWVGTKVSIGNLPITVTALGRRYVLGSVRSHAMKIVNAATGGDVPGTAVTVSAVGGVPGTFAYANLPAGVTLAANSSYYILTREAVGGDQWYDLDTGAQSTTVATLTGAVYGTPYVTVGGTAGHMYGPVDLKYALAVSVSVAPASVTLSGSDTQLFAATVTGSATTSVNWAISPIVGTVAAGLYTAPPTISSSQSVIVTATSVADPTAFGTATVNLVPPAPPSISSQPQSATVTAGQSAVFSVGASGGTLGYQWYSKAPGAGSFSLIGGATLSSYTAPPAGLPDSGTQFYCAVSNSNGPVNSNIAVLTVVSDTPFVTSSSLGTLRNDFSGWVGMSISVHNTALSVSSLGRMVIAGNSGSHAVKIVTAAGNDVPGGSVVVNTSGAPGTSAYAALSSPVVLSANTTYYILSQEAAGGDRWYDLNTTLQSTAVASIGAAVYSWGTGYVAVGNTGGHSYVPVDFRYTSIAAPPSSSLVTSITAGTARNDFGGWVGGSFTTGSSPLTVTQVGRLYLSGNSGTHTVKLVTAGGADIPGGSASVNLSGGVPGAFNYAALASSVILNPNTTYYIVSKETAGGDQWYDYNTSVQTGSEAAVNGGVYSFDGVTYIVVAAPQRMYVPVDFKHD